jgi:hypothetical protein
MSAASGEIGWVIAGVAVLAALMVAAARWTWEEVRARRVAPPQERPTLGRSGVDDGAGLH